MEAVEHRLIDEQLPTLILHGDVEHRTGVRLLSDGWDLGTWIDSEWDGISPHSTLFAAAPALLDACKAVVAGACPGGQAEGPDGPVNTYWLSQSQLDQCVAAIVEASK